MDSNEVKRSIELSDNRREQEPTSEAVEDVEAKADDAKSSHSKSSHPLSIASSCRSPITEHYLTFDTDLPIPTSFEIDGSRGPQAPDLKHYASPVTWPNHRKTLTTLLCCASTTLAAYAAGSYGPPVAQMMTYFNVSQLAILAGITSYTTGFAVAPMVLAPFSELRGRKPMFIASGILFFICQICCGVTRSYPGLILARLGAGVGSSTFSTMVGGVISDIYSDEGLYFLSAISDRLSITSFFRTEYSYGCFLWSGALCNRTRPTLLWIHYSVSRVAVGLLYTNYLLFLGYLNGGNFLQGIARRSTLE